MHSFPMSTFPPPVYQPPFQYHTPFLYLPPQQPTLFLAPFYHYSDANLDYLTANTGKTGDPMLCLRLPIPVLLSPPLSVEEKKAKDIAIRRKRLLYLPESIWTPNLVEDHEFSLTYRQQGDRIVLVPSILPTLFILVSGSLQWGQFLLTEGSMWFKSALDTTQEVTVMANDTVLLLVPFLDFRSMEAWYQKIRSPGFQFIGTVPSAEHWELLWSQIYAKWLALAHHSFWMENGDQKKRVERLFVFSATVVEKKKESEETKQQKSPKAAAPKMHSKARRTTESTTATVGTTTRNDPGSFLAVKSISFPSQSESEYAMPSPVWKEPEQALILLSSSSPLPSTNLLPAEDWNNNTTTTIHTDQHNAVDILYPPPTPPSVFPAAEEPFMQLGSPPIPPSTIVDLNEEEKTVGQTVSSSSPSPPSLQGNEFPSLSALYRFWLPCPASNETLSCIDSILGDPLQIPIGSTLSMDVLFRSFLCPLCWMTVGNASNYDQGGSRIEMRAGVYWRHVRGCTSVYTSPTPFRAFLEPYLHRTRKSKKASHGLGSEMEKILLNDLLRKSLDEPILWTEQHRDTMYQYLNSLYNAPIRNKKRVLEESVEEDVSVDKRPKEDFISVYNMSMVDDDERVPYHGEEEEEEEEKELYVGDDLLMLVQEADEEEGDEDGVGGGYDGGEVEDGDDPLSMSLAAGIQQQASRKRARRSKKRAEGKEDGEEEKKAGPAPRLTGIEVNITYFHKRNSHLAFDSPLGLNQKSHRFYFHHDTNRQFHGLVEKLRQTFFSQYSDYAIKKEECVKQKTETKDSYGVRADRGAIRKSIERDRHWTTEGKVKRSLTGNIQADTARGLKGGSLIDDQANHAINYRTAAPSKNYFPASDRELAVLSAPPWEMKRDAIERLHPDTRMYLIHMTVEEQMIPIAAQVICWNEDLNLATKVEHLWLHRSSEMHLVELKVINGDQYTKAPKDPHTRFLAHPYEKQENNAKNHYQLQLYFQLQFLLYTFRIVLEERNAMVFGIHRHKPLITKLEPWVGEKRAEAFSVLKSRVNG